MSLAGHDIQCESKKYVISDPEQSYNFLESKLELKTLLIWNLNSSSVKNADFSRSSL